MRLYHVLRTAALMTMEGGINIGHLVLLTFDSCIQVHGNCTIPFLLFSFGFGLILGIPLLAFRVLDRKMTVKLIVRWSASPSLSSGISRHNWRDPYLLFQIRPKVDMLLHYSSRLRILCC